MSTLTDAERSLLEALTAHLASGMENLRLQGAGARGGGVAGARLPGARAARLDRAVAGLPEDPGAADARRAGRRRPARMPVLDEIDAGVRESYGDVRELLVHFRTRTNAEDIEPALRPRCASSSTRAAWPRSPCTAGPAAGTRRAGPGAAHRAGGAVQRAQARRRRQVWLDVQQQPRGASRCATTAAAFDPRPGRPTRPMSACASCASAPSASARAGGVLAPGAAPRCAELPRPGGRARPARRSAAGHDDRHDTTEPPSTIRILVVDDHTLFRRGLMALLARDPRSRWSAMRPTPARRSAGPGPAARRDPARQPPARRQRRGRAAGAARGLPRGARC
jgi:hypothetical protein